MEKIIDAHSHYIPPEIAKNTAFYKVHWSNIDKQLRVMDSNGIEKALLLYPTSDAHIALGFKKLSEIYNKSILDVTKKFPGRFIGAGILPLDSSDATVSELNRIKDYGFKVISLPSSYENKFLDDDIFVPIFEFADNNKFIIHVHPQIINPIGQEIVLDPLLTPVFEYLFDVSMSIGKMLMSGTFKKYPNLQFIFAHYGGVLPFVKERFDNTYIMLRARNFVKDLEKLPSEYFKNIYFDTSGSKSPASLQCALELCDASHIMFGSDFPANQDVASSISSIRKSPISDDEKMLIFENNMLQFI